MSDKSAVTTRSKLRKLAAEKSARRTAMEDRVTDSGVPSEIAPGSPSVALTTTPVPAPVIPVVGGRLIDHSEKPPLEPVAEQVSVRSHRSRSSRVSSKSSRKSAEYLRKRVEYEAERELVRLRENLVKKKLEADLAEIDAAAEESSSDEETTRRVEEWIDTTPQQMEVLPCTSRAPPAMAALRESSEHCAPSASAAPRELPERDATCESPAIHAQSAFRELSASHAPPTSRAPETVAAREPPVPASNRRLVPTMFATPAVNIVHSAPQIPTLSNPTCDVLEWERTQRPQCAENEHRRYEDGRRDTSYDRRDRKIDQLAEAITNLARPRPVPRQAYELPHFNGNPSDWISYKNMYWDTTHMYEFKPHENLARLKTSLQGDAKIAVEDLLRSFTNPTDIMKALEEEFGHPNLVLECALQKVRSLPRVTESGRELRKFATTVRNCVSLLRNIRAEGYLNNPQLVSELLSKLTPVQRAQYGDFAMGLESAQGVDLRVSPSLEILAKFLAHLARASSFYTQLYMPPATPATSGVKNKAQTLARTQFPRHAQRVNVQCEGKASPDDEKTCQQDTKCVSCQKSHALQDCGTFADMSVDDRWEFVKEKKLCFKCLGKRHSKRHCRAKRCEKCGYAHHVLLHLDKSSIPNTPESVTNVGEGQAKALLKIMPVKIGDNKTECYALLDDGATVSLLDNSLADELEGPVVPLTIISARGHEVTDSTSRKVSVNIQGPNGKCYSIRCRTITNLNLPPQTIPAVTIEESAHLRDLGCEEMRGARPLLLLGQDNWELLVNQDIRRGKSGKPVASLTRLGWVMHGPFGNEVRNCNHQSVNCVSISLPDLHDIVKAPFELESIGIVESTRKHHDIERAKALLDSTSRHTTGESQWEVGLLWKKDNIELPDNYSQARRRLEGIERRMKRDPLYAEAYARQVERLVSEGYAEKVDGRIKASPVWYLPHFGVVNPNKPGKLRLVFDAAATYQGTCLNDNLFTGPDLLNSLLGVLFKFRLGPIAFSADIADMFLRIRIRGEDQGAQLFLWRSAPHDKEPSIHVMKSMIFGAVSSPTTAIYILNKNADKYESSYPDAVKAIKSKHYMDDYLDSVWTVEQAGKLIEEVTQIHATGGFNIRGWVTNSPELRIKLKSDMPDRVILEKAEHTPERTLGMFWSPELDNLAFDLSFKKLPADIITGKVVPTKREFLRVIMSIFDPLGFLYPCIIQSRVLMQRIWRSGIQWDEKLREPDARVWKSWLGNLHVLRDFKVPRWYGLQPEGLELHVFGDASELAYAAVAYIVGRNSNGDRQAAMVVGKARVSPQKVISIPRLELQAAVLASRLACAVETDLGLNIESRFLWTDSRTVLKWISSEAYEFQRFVSHRLAEIDRRSKRNDWRWVPSADNPADKATRLDWPNNCEEWLSGPSFLLSPQERWPVLDEVVAVEADLERVQRVHVTTATDSMMLNLEEVPTWTRAVRVTARVRIFIDMCRKRRPTPELQVSDLRTAELYLISRMQQGSYPTEIRALRQGLPVPKNSKIKSLDPILYEDGLLRVRGRLSVSETLTFDEKHPIILDGRHSLTRKLIAKYHEAALHANQETVLNNIRERFWITNLRATVKSVIGKCQMCRIRKAKPTSPKMGDLPPARLEPTKRAFIHCGVDYFGPMMVAIGRRREKRWGVLFTCLTTRAIHLELAGSLSADSAILALRRMIARRGQPSHLYSDRGTNFVGADNELRAALKELDHGLVREEATRKGIDWHFNPPASPHMGGCWERLVRSVKNALRVTLKENAPREEVLYTLLTEAELIINSRPLSYVACNSDQPVVLTPNHLLLGTSSGCSTFAPQLSGVIDCKQQWRRVNALADVFWKRWLREYLPTLQRRSKWNNNVPNAKVGDIVLITDDAKSRNEWLKGTVKSVYHGKDAIVRVVDIKTKNGVLRRPVVKIIVLPTDGDVIG